MSKSAHRPTGPKRSSRSRTRAIAFGVLTVVILTVGALLAFGKLASRPGTGATGQAVSIQRSIDSRSM